MDCVGCSLYWLLLCVLYVVSLLNVLSIQRDSFPAQLLLGRSLTSLPILTTISGRRFLLRTPMRGSVLHIGAGLQINKVISLLTMYSSMTCTNSSNAATFVLPRMHSFLIITRHPHLLLVISPHLPQYQLSIQYPTFDEPIHLPAFSLDELLGITLI